MRLRGVLEGDCSALFNIKISKYNKYAFATTSFSIWRIYLIATSCSTTVMAEVGAVASIIALVATGAKLSLFLFEVSSSLGSAGTEIQQIAVEISLFCSVLKQLRNTLAKARGCRYSLSALETTNEIFVRCTDIFNEINNLLAGFKSKSKDGDVDWRAKMKWAFKKGDIKVLRTTLESCKITLHIMLTTMDFAQQIASRR
jgi:hypothetical protein